MSLGLRGLSNFTKDFLLSKHLLRVGRGARETVKSIFSALPEESSLAPSTHVRRLITTCNSSSGGLDTLFWSLHSRAQNFKSNKSLKKYFLGLARCSGGKGTYQQARQPEFGHWTPQGGRTEPSALSSSPLTSTGLSWRVC